MTVHELETRISRSEFVEWLAYEDIETERHDKQEYYLAQIAQAVERPHLKPGVRTKINDYLIKFSNKKDAPIKLSVEQMAAVFGKLFGKGDK